MEHLETIHVTRCYDETVGNTGMGSEPDQNIVLLPLKHTDAGVWSFPHEGRYGVCLYMAMNTGFVGRFQVRLAVMRWGGDITYHWYKASEFPMERLQTFVFPASLHFKGRGNRIWWQLVSDFEEPPTLQLEEVAETITMVVSQ